MNPRKSGVVDLLYPPCIIFESFPYRDVCMRHLLLLLHWQGRMEQDLGLTHEDLHRVHIIVTESDALQLCRPLRLEPDDGGLQHQHCILFKIFLEDAGVNSRNWNCADIYFCYFEDVSHRLNPQNFGNRTMRHLLWSITGCLGNPIISGFNTRMDDSF